MDGRINWGIGVYLGYDCFVGDNTKGIKTLVLPPRSLKQIEFFDMKHTLPLFLLLFTIDSFSLNFSDTIAIDKERIATKIEEIKKSLEPKNYHIWEEGFKIKDITYSFPTLIDADKPFVIDIMWKENLIFQYDVDPKTFETVLISDLR
ncbi:MAG: hypothetical protein WAQ28_09325 [Bacteroidia bacterium]